MSYFIASQHNLGLVEVFLRVPHFISQDPSGSA